MPMLNRVLSLELSAGCLNYSSRGVSLSLLAGTAAPAETQPAQAVWLWKQVLSSQLCSNCSCVGRIRLWHTGIGFSWLYSQKGPRMVPRYSQVINAEHRRKAAWMSEQPSGCSYNEGRSWAEAKPCLLCPNLCSARGAIPGSLSSAHTEASCCWVSLCTSLHLVSLRQWPSQKTSSYIAVAMSPQGRY